MKIDPLVSTIVIATCLLVFVSLVGAALLILVKTLSSVATEVTAELISQVRELKGQLGDTELAPEVSEVSVIPDAEVQDSLVHCGKPVKILESNVDHNGLTTIHARCQVCDKRLTFNDPNS